MNKKERDRVIKALRLGMTGINMDCEVARAFNFKLLAPRDDYDWRIDPGDGDAPFPLPPYTSSYDAALLLLEEDWGFTVSYDIRDERLEYVASAVRRVYYDTVKFKADTYGGRSKTGPAALCIAAIRARYRD